MGGRGVERGMAKAAPTLSIGAREALRLVVFAGLYLESQGWKKRVAAGKENVGPVPAGPQGSGILRCPAISRTGPRLWCIPGHQPQMQKAPSCLWSSLCTSLLQTTLHPTARWRLNTLLGSRTHRP